MRGPKFIVAIVLTAVLSVPVLAQRRRDNTPPQRQERREFRQQQRQRDQPLPRTNGANNAGPNRFQRPHMGDWLRHQESLAPADQQKQLEKDPNFQKLPPQRQEELKQRLQKFNNLPPDQKQRVINRMDLLEHMSPAQREQTRELFQQFRQIDPARKEVVRNEIRRMRTLSPDDRQRFYDSDDFRSRFSPQEQNVVRGMGDMPQPDSPGAQESH